MISRHPQIRQQVEALRALAGAPGQVQKIYSTSRLLCLQLRFPGRSVYLYVGRGGGHEGIWTGMEPPPASLRLRDVWLEWCRKNLTGSLFQAVELDPGDRAVRLVFRQGGEAATWYVFWAGRTSYFAFHRAGVWFLSWRGRQEGPDGFSVFDEVGRRTEAAPLEELTPGPAVQELLREEEAAALKARLPARSRVKAMERKVGHIRGDLEKIRAWLPFQEWIAATPAEEWEGAREVSHGPLRYKFPPGLGAWQKKDWLFQQVKRLRAAEAKQASRLEEALAELEGKATPVVTEGNPLKPIRPVWKTLATGVPAPAASSPEAGYAVHAVDGARVGVGKSARGNDQLRKEWAKAQDWWVHAAQGVSAHAVLKLDEPGVPTPAHFNAAARLLAEQTGLTGGRLEVIVTQVKNLKGVTGTAGLVTYKKQRTLLCVWEN